MQRLTGMDAAFLYMETPHMYMHVAGLMVLASVCLLLVQSDKRAATAMVPNPDPTNSSPAR